MTLIETFPDTAILLVDTYDPLAGAEIAATLGKKVMGVRLDSGDLLGRAGKCAPSLTVMAGALKPRIVASGDLNEYQKIEEW